MNDGNKSHLDAISAFFNDTFQDAEETHISKPESSKTQTMKRKLDGDDDNVEEKITKIDSSQDKLETTENINSIDHLKNIQQFNDVESVLNNWLHQTLYIETKLQKSHDLRKLIDESIEKLRRDGLLTFIEYDQLHSIGNLWYELDEQIICYSIGTENNKRRIIEILLSLYALKQISSDLFLNTVMQL